jgi:hypothetical protein
MIHPLLSQCRIVELESPFALWDDPSVRRLFEKTTTLKFTGYGQQFPRGVMPADTCDWVADHFLLCRHHRGELEPIMGFRRATLARYREHYIPFTPLSMCHESGCAAHIREIERLVEQFEKRPDLLSYTGSFAILPQLQADPMLKQELLELLVILYYLFHEEEDEGHEIITAAAPRFKYDLLLQGYGFIPLLEVTSENDEGTIPARHVGGEPVRLLRARVFNTELKERAERYRALWTNRTILRRADVEAR